MTPEAFVKLATNLVRAGFVPGRDFSVHGEHLLMTPLVCEWIRERVPDAEFLE